MRRPLAALMALLLLASTAIGLAGSGHAAMAGAAGAAASSERMADPGGDPQPGMDGCCATAPFHASSDGAQCGFHCAPLGWGQQIERLGIGVPVAAARQSDAATAVARTPFRPPIA